MKSIIRLAVIVLAMAPAFGFAQTDKKAVWPEMKNFIHLCLPLSIPQKKETLAPLKAKAADLLKAAKEWQASRCHLISKRKKQRHNWKNW